MGYEFAQVRWRITTTTTFVSLRASNWDCLFVFFNGGSTNYLFLLKIKSAFRCCLLSSSSEYKYTLLELWNHTRVKVCYFFSRLNGTSSSRYFIIVLLSFHWLMLAWTNESLSFDFHLLSVLFRVLQPRSAKHLYFALLQPVQWFGVIQELKQECQSSWQQSQSVQLAPSTECIKQ